jgi:hypothetical protein
MELAFVSRPVAPSILQQLRFYLKADGRGEEEDEEEELPPLAFAFDGEDMNMEIEGV